MLDSPLSPDECRRALESETGVLWGKPVLRGLLSSADRMVLRKRHVWLNNGFETLADVTLRPSAHGTQVAITWRSHYFVAAFITLWLGLVVLIAGFGAVLSGKPEASAFVLVFVLFGFGFMALGRLLARPDRSVLLEFIAQVTAGLPYPDATLPPM